MRIVGDEEKKGSSMAVSFTLQGTFRTSDKLFFVISKIKGTRFFPVYESERRNKILNSYIWSQTSVLVDQLIANNDYECEIKIEVFKHSEGYKHTLYGSKHFTLA